MANEALSVKCLGCDWRGRRVRRDCECDEWCSCQGFTPCPKCGGDVRTLADAKWIHEEGVRLKQNGQLDAKDRSTVCAS